jgi:hypothetical protein
VSWGQEELRRLNVRGIRTERIFLIFEYHRNFSPQILSYFGYGKVPPRASQGTSKNGRHSHTTTQTKNALHSLEEILHLKTGKAVPRAILTNAGPGIPTEAEIYRGREAWNAWAVFARSTEVALSSTCIQVLLRSGG